MVGYLIVGGVFGLGFVVVAALLVGRVRDRRRWAGESLAPSAVAGQEFEDPAAGGSTAGTEQNTTGAWANGQAESRVLGINTSPYGHSNL